VSEEGVGSGRVEEDGVDGLVDDVVILAVTAEGVGSWVLAGGPGPRGGGGERGGRRRRVISSSIVVGSEEARGEGELFSSHLVGCLLSICVLGVCVCEREREREREREFGVFKLLELRKRGACVCVCLFGFG